jgi:TonB family protein
MTFEMYKLDGKQQESGTIEEWWASPTVHRVTITSPSLSPSGVVPPETRMRASYLANLLLAQVVHPVERYAKFDHLSVAEMKRKVGRSELSCFEVSRSEIADSSNSSLNLSQYCLEPGTDELRVTFGPGAFAGIRNKLGKFQGVVVALQNQLSYSGKPAITGDVTTLELLKGDPPQPAQEAVPTSTRDVPEALPSIVLAGHNTHKQPPEYPAYARERHIAGSVVMNVVISKEGTIKSIAVVGSPDPSLSQAAMEAVKKWTYSPYLLNNQPTEVDTSIVVNFAIGG